MNVKYYDCSYCGRVRHCYVDETLPGRKITLILIGSIQLKAIKMPHCPDRSTSLGPIVQNVSSIGLRTLNILTLPLLLKSVNHPAWQPANRIQLLKPLVKSNRADRDVFKSCKWRRMLSLANMTVAPEIRTADDACGQYMTALQNRELEKSAAGVGSMR